MILLTLITLLARASVAADYGILLLAHGGDARWNATAGEIRAKLDAQAPTELALGMAELDALQRGVDALQRRGVEKIVALPLFVHSRSEVLDQTAYALGLREQPSHVLRRAYEAMARHAGHAGHGAHGAHGHSMTFSLERVRASVPIVMARALDDSALVADVAARRARALSRKPARETVLLVAHGPVDDDANEVWLQTMSRQAARVQQAGGFKAVESYTIRDDAPKSVRDAAIAKLREAVKAASKSGRAVVVPYLIARGGIEEKLVDALKGLSYAWDGATLCPDPAIERHLAEEARAAAAR